MRRETQVNPNGEAKGINNKNFLVDRRIRGYSILAKGDKPIVINEEEFLVPSQSINKKYKVTSINGWTCECPDFQKRCKGSDLKCKHIMCIEFFLKLRDNQNDKLTEFFDELDLSENEKNCPECKSRNIVNNGKSETKI